MGPGIRIDYKALRAVNPEAARKSVLEYLKTNGSDKGVLLDPGIITPPFINLYEIHLVGL